MPTYRLTLAYDGTDFAGWQAQAEGRGRTVQGTLEDALATLSGGARVVVAGAGRTDAGVHALGQVASFAWPSAWDPAELMRAINAVLPDDVRALEASLCDDAFHARRSATSKLYRYTLDTGPVQLPVRRRFAGHVPWALEEEAVRAAAALFRGEHDFASLASAGGSVKTTVRTVTRSDMTPDPGSPGTWIYETEANGFLRKMVRSMMGAIVEAGRGSWTVESLQKALEARDRRAWPAPAAARGLTLVRVSYGTAPSGPAVRRE
jgi:tRNA pseudouridine38-40 synthase